MGSFVSYYELCVKQLSSHFVGKSEKVLLLVILILFLMNGTASAWPIDEQWNVVVNESGNLTDLIGDYATADASPKIQIIGNSSYPSAYMFNDGAYLNFRMRLLGDPTKTGQNYLDNGNVWGVEFDTDGNSSNYEYILFFSGGKSSPEIDFYKNDHGGTIGSPGDTSTILLWNVILESGNWTYFRVVDAPDIFQVSADNNTFIEWRMPYDIFQNLTNTTNESSMRLIFGTSKSNGNLAGDIAASATDGDLATVADSVSAPVLPTGTMTTNGSVSFVADLTGSGDVTIININDTVYVKVNDSDQNSDSLSNQTVSVKLLTSNGDNETITLNETGNDTGVFTGSIVTNSAIVNTNNGTLQIIESGSFNVTYSDMTSEGLYVDRIDNASVSDSTPPASITNLVNVSYAETYINWTWTDPEDADFSYVSIWIDGTWITNVSKGIQYYLNTSFTANTTYNISTHTVDTSGNINTTWVNKTTTTATGTPPVVTILTPLNGTYTNDNTIFVNSTFGGETVANAWAVIDNDTQESGESNTLFYNFTTLSLSDGLHNITVYANDSAGNLNSSMVNFTVDTTLPIITFESPANNSNLSQNYIQTNLTVDDTNFKNVTTYIYYGNGTLLNSSTNTTYPALNNFTGLDDGTYTINATSFDRANNSNTSESITITIDTTIPIITFVNPTPANNSNLPQNYIQINLTVYDITFKNVTTYIYYGNGTLLNSSTNMTYPALNNFTDLDDGTYIINATAYDYVGKVNTSLSRTITLGSGVPDLNLTSNNITYVYDTDEQSRVTETGEVRENINLTINATIQNQGTVASGSFNVLFYDGDSEFYNVSMSSLASGLSANATGYWTTLPGTHNITIKVDPASDTSDSDRSNNNASKFINVSAWQKYYGNVNSNGKISLGDGLGNYMLNWSWSNLTDSGNIFVIDQGAVINWSTLHPLGYDKNDNQNTTGQDFLDADINLGMTTGNRNSTGFVTNNLTESFTNTSGSNYGNNTISKTSFKINGITIENVPILNSTDITNHAQMENANFITGILWDDTKDNNGYYDQTDKEDLVLVANIRQAAVGLDGKSHNYEISIPATLNSTTNGSVEFYMELI